MKTQSRKAMDAGFYFSSESEADRYALFRQVKFNGQPIDSQNPLQVTNTVDLIVPDGFRMIVVPDSHGTPHYGVLRGMGMFAERYRPHMMKHIGDWSNLPFMSRFPSNPVNGPAYSPQDEMSHTERHLRLIMSWAYHTIAEAGNHDDLPLRFVQNQAPLLGRYLNAKTRNPLLDLVTNLMNFTLKDPITFVWGRGQRGGREGGTRFAAEVPGGELLATHGSAVDNVPARSSYKEWMKRFISVIMGHVHRAGDWGYETVLGVTFHGLEIGSIVDWDSSDMEYSPDHNWVHAFGVIEKHNGVIFRKVVPILTGVDEAGRQYEYFIWRDQQNNTVVFPCY